MLLLDKGCQMVWDQNIDLGWNWKPFIALVYNYGEILYIINFVATSKREMELYQVKNLGKNENVFMYICFEFDQII